MRHADWVLWTDQHDSSFSHSANRYVFRRQANELLVRGGAYQSARTAECYAITIEEPSQFHRVPLDAWGVAEPVEGSLGKLVWDPDESHATHEGRRYVAAGSSGCLSLRPMVASP